MSERSIIYLLIIDGKYQMKKQNISRNIYASEGYENNENTIKTIKPL